MANMKIDDNRNAIPTWRSFTTAKHTIATGATWESVTIPTGAVEAYLTSDASFYVGESSSATGASVNNITIGFSNMTAIYLKGTLAQGIEIIWGIL